MPIKILIFGGLKEILKRDALEMPFTEGMTVEQSFSNLIADDCQVKDFWSTKILYAVNLEHVGPSHLLCDGDEVAFMPPVSGG